MKRKKDRSNGITALYERLSRDDDNAGESNSITHQDLICQGYFLPILTKPFYGPLDTSNECAWGTFC